jgi:acetyl-CoA acyltransferase 2
MAEWAGGKTGEGKPGGGLAGISAIDLGAHAAKAALEKSQVKAEAIDEVIFGNALQTSPDAIYGARHVGLKAGVPKERPALTVNRLCGSGIEAIVQAQYRIQLGHSKIVLAGGMENLSQAPFVVRGARQGLKLGQGQLEDYLMASLMDSYSKCYMAVTAENLAREYSISREDQDAYALRSFRAAEKAISSGIFAEEVAPVEVPLGRSKSMSFQHDDHFFPSCTLEGLSKLRPAFAKDGFVTAGNASGLVDGAAALVVAGENTVASGHPDPLARIVAHAVVGVEPSRMGIGPVPAIKAVLEQAKLSLNQVDRFEINEAFAAQYLAVETELKLDRDKVNVNGGAIAIGHPLAATGTRLLLTLALELRRQQLRFGVASACIGGGQGIAMLIENPRAA